MLATQNRWLPLIILVVLLLLSLACIDATDKPHNKKGDVEMEASEPEPPPAEAAEEPFDEEE